MIKEYNTKFIINCEYYIQIFLTHFKDRHCIGK